MLRRSDWRHVLGRFRRRLPRRHLMVESYEPRLMMDAAPIAVEDNFVVLEDGTLSISAPGLLLNDFDAESDPFVLDSVTAPRHGNLVWQSDGAFQYKPSPNYFGTDSFTYVLRDGFTLSAPGTVNLTILPVSDNRIGGRDEVYFTREDQSLTVSGLGRMVAETGFNDAAGILSNGTAEQPYKIDSIVGGRGEGEPGWIGPWQVSGQAATVTGQRMLEGDGALKLQGLGKSARQWDATNTADAFTVQWRARFDAQASQTFRLFDPSAGLFEADPVTSTAVQVNIEADGRILVYDRGLVENTGLRYQPDTWHTFTLMIDPRKSTFRIAVDGQQYSSPDTLEYRGTPQVVNALSFENRSENAHITVDSLQVFTGLALPGLAGNDENVDQLPLVAQLISQPGQGTITLQNDGTFVYSPRANFHGVDSFTYRTRNGDLLSETQTATIVVDSVFDPAAALDDSYAMDEDGVLEIVDANKSLLANDKPGDAGDLTILLVSPPTRGDLTLAPDGRFTYRPAANYFGSDVFTYRLVPQNGPAATASVTIQVRPVADAVVPREDLYELDEDTTLRAGVRTVVKSISTGYDDLLGEKIPSLGEDLDYVVVENPLGAEVGYQVGRNPITIPGAQPHGSYVPDAASITSRWVGLIRRTRGDFNEFPTNYVFETQVNLTGFDATTAYIENLRFAADGRIRQITVNGTTVHNGAEGFTTFTSAGNVGLGLFQPGINSIRFDVDNTWAGGFSPMGFRIDGKVVAYPTVGRIEGGVLANDDNPDQLPLTITLATPPAHGTLSLNTNGSFTYTPEKDFRGEDQFQYASSNGVVPPTTVRLNVKPIDNEPRAALDRYEVPAGILLTAGMRSVVKNFGSALDDSTGAKLPALTEDLDFVIVGGTYDGRHPVAMSGERPFGNFVPDSSSRASRWMAIRNGTSYNVAPGEYAFETKVDLTGYDASSAMINDLRYAADDVLWRLEVNGVDIIPHRGEYPDAFLDQGDFGLGKFQPGINTLRFVVVNRESSPNPMALRLEGQVVANLAVPKASLLANDAAPRGLPLLATLVDPPTHGTLQLYPDGSFTYRPADGFVGIERFTYQAADSAGTSPPATVIIRVGNVVPGDTDNDQDVDSADLAILLANWTGGLLPEQGAKDETTGDIDRDGDVDSSDLVDFLANWTGSLNAQLAVSTPAALPQPMDDVPISDIALAVDSLYAEPAGYAASRNGIDPWFGESS